jgi:NAD(P)H-hydrate repair Nnr-like enzyme with NAD(P)H-hydrate dehydratase domain
MNPSYWRRQTSKPLFPELEWSRPENQRQAGKLLIIGGHAQGFAGPAEAYAAAQTAGVGVSRVLLPDALQRTVGKLFPEAEFTPSNPSGGFAATALGELLGASEWADGVLLGGTLGRNSETLVLLENFADKYAGQLTITADAADHFVGQPSELLQRPDTLLVISLGQLQKLGSAAHFPRAFTSTMDLLQLVENLHEFTRRYAPFIIVKAGSQLVVAGSGEVSTTQLAAELPIWRVKTAARTAVWWLQNPTKPFEALTTAMVA